jgi:2-isopropylmalate synthase
LIGLTDNSIVLGKLSGRNAFRTHLESMGIELSENDLNKAFLRFKDVAVDTPRIESTGILS